MVQSPVKHPHQEFPFFHHPWLEIEITNQKKKGRKKEKKQTKREKKDLPEIGETWPLNKITFQESRRYKSKMRKNAP